MRARPARRRRPALAVALTIAFAALAASAGCSGRASVAPVSAAGIDSLRHASRARVLLLNVWATWCRPCLDEMPGIVRLRDDYSRDDLDVLLLSADDLSDLDSAVVPFLERTGVGFPTWIIGERDQDAVIRALDPEWSGALPATILSLRGGAMSRTLVGERTYEQLKSEVDALLAQ